MSLGEVEHDLRRTLLMRLVATAAAVTRKILKSSNYFQSSFPSLNQAGNLSHKGKWGRWLTSELDFSSPSSDHWRHKGRI